VKPGHPGNGRPRHWAEQETDAWSFAIDPAELHRVFPPTEDATRSDNGSVTQDATHSERDGVRNTLSAPRFCGAADGPRVDDPVRLPKIKEPRCWSWVTGALTH
jgi:hypothetical protein